MPTKRFVPIASASPSLVVALTLLSCHAVADVEVSVVQKLSASDATADDEFGFSLWTDGSRLAIGALADDDLGTNSGGVYLFGREGDLWVEQGKVLAPDGEAGDQFGQVRLLGDVLAVGARTDDLAGAPNAGSVYLYNFDVATGEWLFAQQLTASAASVGDACTLSDLSADRLVMPCTRDNPGGLSDAGSLFLFARAPGEIWEEVAQVTPLAPNAGDNFGGGAVDGAMRLIGASRRADAAGEDSGALWAFEQQLDGSWLDLGQVLPTDLAAGDEYGARGVLAGELLAVGAPESDQVADGAGAVYLFERDQSVATGWRERATLLGDGSGPGHNLGRGLTFLSSDLLIAGAPDDDALGGPTGAIYVFRRDECGDGAWGQAARFTPSDAGPGDLFGRQMTAADGVLAVSAWSHDLPVVNAGAVYVLQVSEPLDTDGDGVLDDRDNCSEVANADQRDSNGDGFGNLCDADLDDSGRVTIADLRALLERFGTGDLDADLDGDGVVTLDDFSLARSQLFQVPGPSGPARCAEQLGAFGRGGAS